MANRTTTISSVLPSGKISDILANIPLSDLVEFLLEKGQYDVFQRFLDELYDSGRIDRDTYSKISSMVVELMWTDNEAERLRLIERIFSLIPKKGHHDE